MLRSDDMCVCVTTIAPMKKARGSLRLAVLGGKLYVIGGTNDLSSVECLDLSIPDGPSTPVASMTILNVPSELW